MTTSLKENKSGSKRLKSSLKTRLLILSMFIMLIGLSIQCASIQQPTGGPKDSIPPKILLESPTNFSKNFTAKKIVITFDEYIKLANQQKEFSITPDMGSNPEFKVKKKNLEITLPDSLEKNTTYSIYFGKGLVDYNAGNALVNYAYVFATGDKIDSLSISGNVKSAVTKEVQKDVKVLLIPTSQDSIFGKKKANIFTTTDTAGNYKLNNLREGTYRIYALQEKNNDRIYNGADEEIGFLKDSIVLERDLNNINLEIFKGTPKKFRTQEKKFEKNGSILLIFNRRVDKPKLNILNDEVNNKDKIVRFSNTSDSATLFIPNLKIDSLKLVLTENERPLDTILIRKGNVKIEQTIDPIFTPNNGRVDRITHLQVSAFTPIKNIDKTKLKFKEDSLVRTNYQLAVDTANSNIYHIRYNWRKDKKYQIEFTEGAITGYFGEQNKEKKLDLTYDDSENYGDLTFDFTDLDSNTTYLVELINEKKDKVYRVDKINMNNPTVVYKQYPGGKYSIRVIRDDNDNGIWDTGDVEKKTFPEPVIYLNKVFTIRANWEQKDSFSLNGLKKE
ncbi:Ig-like domain-containing protein [Sphingobacterium multivorum]|uniref:Ig-like domain-containing protein n=1 Tax=Sphingobacterium multivorum TaxID=28454 RepID=A0ABX7CNN4_SPHMU|nr:Ig-like domain-containing protein [Sphingobacterium multivorum]QQT30689.1 Ig-like domain-containing protein [Sphingobacterium multivorum]QQT53334.1 Ig-like domain-containing protein [Sphingobacterium multivorum]